MIVTRCCLLIAALMAVVVAMGAALPALAQSKGKGRVRVEHVSVSPNVLHLSAANGPTCGTATLRVAAQGLGQFPNPTLVVSLAGYSTDPPGVTVGIANLHPTTGRVRVTVSPTELTFQVCAKGSKAGKVIVQGAIIGASPASEYEVEAPDAVSALAGFSVRE